MKLKSVLCDYDPLFFKSAKGGRGGKGRVCMGMTVFLQAPLGGHRVRVNIECFCCTQDIGASYRGDDAVVKCTVEAN